MFDGACQQLEVYVVRTGSATPPAAQGGPLVREQLGLSEVAQNTGFLLTL